MAQFFKIKNTKTKKEGVVTKSGKDLLMTDKKLAPHLKELYECDANGNELGKNNFSKKAATA